MSILVSSQVTPVTTWLSIGFCPSSATHAGLSELGKSHSRFESHLIWLIRSHRKRQRHLPISRRPPVDTAKARAQCVRHKANPSPQQAVPLGESARWLRRRIHPTGAVAATRHGDASSRNGRPAGRGSQSEEVLSAIFCPDWPSSLSGF
jgi:hypothetical protein